MNKSQVIERVADSSGGTQDLCKTPDTLPMVASSAQKYFSHLLTPLEQKEILSFQTIFYLGTDLDKKNTDDLSDEWGDYRIIIKDHIAYWFEILEIIGKGSFG